MASGETGKVVKKSAFAYNAESLLQTFVIPRWIHRMHKSSVLKDWEKRPDADYIRQRVDYCFPTPQGASLSETAKNIGDIRLSDMHGCYWYDSMRFLKAFSPSLKADIIDGDTWENPDTLFIGKARRIDSLAGNVALMKLDSRRHFVKVSDNIPFNEKVGKLFFRGAVFANKRRLAFLEKWGNQENSDIMDLGDTTPGRVSPWSKPKVTVEDHFRYKYILALEGNDVATAVQWICASNCVPVMPRPTVETWFLHGKMKSGEHFILIEDDFSDARERMEWYEKHPAEAMKISVASKQWASQFNDPRREEIISYLVAEKYLTLANKTP